MMVFYHISVWRLSLSCNQNPNSPEQTSPQPPPPRQGSLYINVKCSPDQGIALICSVASEEKIHVFRNVNGQQNFIDLEQR